MSPEEPVRVLLVDDQELVRSGLRRILRRRAGFDVVGECEDGDEVPAAVAGHAPDVVVMDLRMRRIDGIEATRALRRDATAPAVLYAIAHRGRLLRMQDDLVLPAVLDGLAVQRRGAEPPGPGVRGRESAK